MWWKIGLAITVALGVLCIEQMQRITLDTTVSVMQPQLPKAEIVFNRTGAMSSSSITIGHSMIGRKQ